MAAYFVEWTLGSPEHGANFDLIVGSWGEGTSAADRWASALEYRVVDGEGSFMVTDSGPRPVGSSDLVGTAFRRGDIIGSPRAAVVFAIADAVYAREPRIQEVRQWVTRARPVR